MVFLCDEAPCDASRNRAESEAPCPYDSHFKVEAMYLSVGVGSLAMDDWGDVDDWALCGGMWRENCTHLVLLSVSVCTEDEGPEGGPSRFLPDLVRSFRATRR